MEQEQRTKPSPATRVTSGRTPLALAGTSFLLELATVASLLLDNCSLATILAVLAALFGGATMYIMSGSGDKPDPFLHDPPPRT